MFLFDAIRTNEMPWFEIEVHVSAFLPFEVGYLCSISDIGKRLLDRVRVCEERF